MSAPSRASSPVFHDRTVLLREDATLRSVAFHDAQIGFAVGDHGTILNSRDGGKTWLPQESGVTCRLDFVTCVTSKQAWAVGGAYEPYTQASQGVFLWTEDGGVTWNQGRGEIPRLRGGRTEDAKRQTLIGDWSPRYQSSIFVTEDHGDSWSPAVNADVGPLKYASSTSPMFLADRRGQLLRSWGDGALERIEGIDQVFALGGHGSIVIAAGQASLFAGPSKQSLMRLNHSALMPLVPCVTAPGDQNLLIAGFPASQTLVCIPGQPSINSDPGFSGMVHGASWLNEKEIVVVGSFGSISKSFDGGVTWQVLRGQERKAGLLQIVDHPCQIPWSLLASESLQQGTRVVIAWISPEPDHRQSDPLWPGMDEIVSQSAAYAGVDDVVHIPLAASQLNIDNCLRGWNPAAINLSLNSSEELRAAVVRWVTQPLQINTHRVSALSSQATGVYQLDPAAAMPRSGRFAGDYQRYSESLFQEGTNQEGPVYLQRVWDRSNLDRWSHLTAGLPISNIAAIRRNLPSSTGGSLARLQARTQYPTLIARARQNAANDPARFEQQLRQLFKQLNPEDRAVLAQDLLLFTEKQNDAVGWRQCIELLAEGKDDLPIVRWAQRVNIQWKSSEEWRQLLRAQTSPTPLPESVAATTSKSPFEAADVAQNLRVNSTGSINRVSLSNMTPMTSATKTESMESLQPHPFYLFLKANPAELLDLNKSASKLAALEQIASLQGSGIWRQRAAEELAMRTQGSRVSQSHEIPIRFAGSQRPKLDGILDDPIWRSPQESSTPSVPFVDHAAEDAVPVNMQVQWAYDADFIYVAARGSLTAEAAPTTRTRDTPLDLSDRLLLEIDVDRDLTTAYRFEIDGLGRTRDSCDGFTAWQPRWFVAANRGTEWIMEAAIHRSDLVELPPARGESWRLRVVQLPANTRLPVGPRINPSQWKTLRFQ